MAVFRRRRKRDELSPRLDSYPSDTLRHGPHVRVCSDESVRRLFRRRLVAGGRLSTDSRQLTPKRDEEWAPRRPPEVSTGAEIRSCFDRCWSRRRPFANPSISHRSRSAEKSAFAGSPLRALCIRERSRASGGERGSGNKRRVGSGGAFIPSRGEGRAHPRSRHEPRGKGGGLPPAGSGRSPPPVPAGCSPH